MSVISVISAESSNKNGSDASKSAATEPHGNRQSGADRFPPAKGRCLQADVLRALGHYGDDVPRNLQASSSSVLRDVAGIMPEHLGTALITCDLQPVCMETETRADRPFGFEASWQQLMP